MTSDFVVLLLSNQSFIMKCGAKNVQILDLGKDKFYTNRTDLYMG